MFRTGDAGGGGGCGGGVEEVGGRPGGETHAEPVDEECSTASIRCGHRDGFPVPEEEPWGVRSAWTLDER